MQENKEQKNWKEQQVDESEKRFAGQKNEEIDPQKRANQMDQERNKDQKDFGVKNEKED